MPARLRTLALASSTAMLVAGPALASSFTPDTFITSGPTELTGTAFVDQFDSSLGILTSVDWVVGIGFQSAVTLTNNAQTAQNISVTVPVDFFFSDFTPGTFSVPDFGASATTGLISIPAGGTLEFSEEEGNILFGLENRSGTETTNLAGWIGGGTVGFDFSTLTGINISGGGGQIGSTQVSGAGLEFTVTYNYREPPTEVIPLPAAGWMLLTALAGLGGAGWMRRRRDV